MRHALTCLMLLLATCGAADVEVTGNPLSSGQVIACHNNTECPSGWRCFYADCNAPTGVCGAPPPSSACGGSGMPCCSMEGVARCIAGHACEAGTCTGCH